MTRGIKKALPEIAFFAGKDIAIVSGAAAITKGFPASARCGTVVAVYTTTKVLEVFSHWKNELQNFNTLSSQNNNSTNMPSVIEPSFNWINNMIANMSDVQIIATCSAVLICVCIMLFTFLILWILGREYVDKFKSIASKYPILNKIFLFYLKWADITSIPARLFFVCFIYFNLVLSLYFLTHMPLFFK